MSHLVTLKADQAIRKLFGWELFPDASTFGKLFKRFNMGHCHELSEAEAEARKRVWSKKWFPRITLEMDSTVIGVTGSQEGAEKGYNPKKKGQKSYHPLLCFIVETRECLHRKTTNGSLEQVPFFLLQVTLCLARHTYMPKNFSVHAQTEEA